MKKALVFASIAALFSMSSCIKNPNKDQIRENLVGTWDLTNHCYEYGTLTFDSDNTGSVWVNDECLVGNACLNVLPFDWTLDEESGLLSIYYDPSGSALMICSSIEHTAPPSETEILTKDTQVIYVYGYTFEHR